jgi:hypothetical protein
MTIDYIFDRLRSLIQILLVGRAKGNQPACDITLPPLSYEDWASYKSHAVALPRSAWTKACH